MWKIGNPPASPALTITQHTCLNHKAQPSMTRSLQTRAVLWGSTCTWRWRGFTLTSCHPHQSKSTIIHCTTWSCLWRDHCSLSEPSFFPTSLLIFWCVICKSPARWSRAATRDGASPSQRCPHQPQSCSRPGSETARTACARVSNVATGTYYLFKHGVALKCLRSEVSIIVFEVFTPFAYSDSQPAFV